MSDTQSVWKNKNFVIIVMAETLSNFGLWFAIIANLEFLQHLVPSDFMKSLILVSGSVLAIFAAPKAGVMIDRGSKKRIIFWSSLFQLVSAGVQVGATGLESVPLMAIGLLITSVANSFYIPTLQSVIPMVVKKDNLLQANAVFMNISTITRILGTAVAGVLLSILPLYGLYICTCIIFACMTVLRSFLHFDENQAESDTKAKEKISFLDVIPLLRKNPELLITTAGITMMLLFLGGFNLLVIGYSEVQHDPAIKGWIYTVEGIFVMLGGIIARKLFSGGDLLRRNVLLMAAVAIAMFLMHFADQKWIVLSGYALFGLTVGLWFPTYGAIPQLIVPEGIRGRYFSFQEMWNRTMSQAALVITGAMLDWLGLRMNMLALSGIIFLGFVCMYVTIRKWNLSVYENVEKRAT